MAVQAKLHLFLFICIVLGIVQISAQPAAMQTKGIRTHGSAAIKPVTPQQSTAPLPQKNPQQRTTYTLDVVMDYAQHTLLVEESISYFNDTNTTLSFITLAIPANLETDCFTLSKLSVQNQLLDFHTLSGQRLEIPLQTPLEPDSTLQINLRFELSLPYQGRFNSLDAHLFGYTDMQANLVHWYPFIVPFKDGEWILNEPWYFGEYLVYPIADYTVNLLFIGEETDPVVAAGGRAERVGQFERYTLKNARSFALSISPHFETSSIETNGVIISSYYLPLHRTPAEAALKSAREAVDAFTKKFGAYPFAALALVQADVNHTSEFSGLSFISRDLYQQYNGPFKNNFTFAVVHTVAHQWWGESVGNDPAREPWLDEALATYSEMTWLGMSSPREKPYWLENRVEFFRPQGNINISIYDTENVEEYKSSAMVNGAKFLFALERRTGKKVFEEFLKTYYQQGKGRLMTGKDFFEILNRLSTLNYDDILDEFAE